MSKLPKAPLVEVIFEIRWNSQKASDLNDFQMLLGSMYTKLEKSYPLRTNLRPDPNIPFGMFLGNPTHRFQSKEGYPLFQLGPGVLSVNTIDNVYEWDNFVETIKQVVEVFFELFHPSEQKATFTLKFLDFFKFDFQNNCLLDFVGSKLNIKINSKFLKEKPQKFTFGTTYEINNKVFALNINTGLNTADNNKVNGLIVESSIAQNVNFSEIKSELEKYLRESHDYLGTFFKEMTKGDLYESFLQ
ncbi:hypothetical protein SDC9_152819 [bioreactor metagenome]|jgi:uncharacterized protein (TIGR04255 family)|uniref:TIGR04255 family protein n=1 Tax=bioreactor metagenome TaxID=1076179 RepID=A0A645EU49_9ZZZZ